jgi:hypothetical protein
MSLQAHHFGKGQNFIIRSFLFDIRYSNLPPRFGTPNIEQGISKSEVQRLHATFRPLVKQHHVWLTSRNRRRTSFTGDFSPLHTRSGSRLRRRGAERQRFKLCCSAPWPICGKTERPREHLRLPSFIPAAAPAPDRVH